MIDGIPLPATDDPVDSIYWDGALCSRLLIQSCADCSAMRFPPRPMCPHCQSSECAWTEVSGRGYIWSFVAPESPLLPAFEALKPYVSALVVLEEDPGLRIVGPVLRRPGGDMGGISAQDVVIGQRVKVDFKQLSEDVAIPCWVLQREA